MAKHRTDQQWASILSAFHRSGLSQAAFCRRRGLALSTFRLRLAASRQCQSPPPGPPADTATPEGAAPALLELPLSAVPPRRRDVAPARRDLPVEIEFPGGVRASLALPAQDLPGLLAELHRLPRP